jgi:hypothetical protein
MKALFSTLSLSIAFSMALAQNPPSQETPQRTPPVSQENNSQPDPKASPSGSASTKLPEMKTTTFKGLLVDVSCSSQTASSAENTQGAAGSASAQANTADRSASGGASCPLSANSSVMGMKLDDGRTVRFDLVGNQRAQDAMKSSKRWSTAVSENKPIQAKVSGVLSGDKLIVSSIR